jgi:hypothetical protein
VARATTTTGAAAVRINDNRFPVASTTLIENEDIDVTQLPHKSLAPRTADTEADPEDASSMEARNTLPLTTLPNRNLELALPRTDI